MGFGDDLTIAVAWTFLKFFPTLSKGGVEIDSSEPQYVASVVVAGA
jgi:hypothetical protein